MEILQKKIYQLVLFKILDYFHMYVVKKLNKYHFYNLHFLLQKIKKIQQELFFLNYFLKHMFILYKIHFMDGKKIIIVYINIHHKY